MVGSSGAGMRRITVGLVLTAGLVFAACGDDDEESASGGGGGSGSPQTLTITATGTEKKPAFDVSPTSVKPGATTIAFENALDKGALDGQLIYLTEEHSDEEVAAEFAKAVQGKAVADWFQGGGGPCCADKRGQTRSVTQDLKAGTYVLLPGEEAKLPLTRIEVKGEGGAEFEPPAARVTATEYAFEGQAVKANAPVLLENGGGTWHHFLASKLKKGATIADARKFLRDEKGEPPFEGEDDEGIDEQSGIESTVLDGGVSQVIEFTGKPGKYAFFCFVADKKGGPPHVAKGMVSEVTVE